MTNRYLSAEKRLTDDFMHPFTRKEGEIVYDAKTRHGPWACMTALSYATHGYGKLGTGFGQKYVRNADGHLVKVAG